MEEYFTVFRKCVLCGSVHVIDLTERDYNGLQAYYEGKSVSLTDALPDVDPEERSLFNSGLCAKCADELLRGHNSIAKKKEVCMVT
jgi:hypothetical protein